MPGIVLMLYACNLEYFDNAEFQDFEWNPSLAIPLGEISYSVSDLFNELNDPNVAISSNAENVVTLLFVEELSAQDASTFLSVQDQGFNGSLQSGVAVPASPIATTINVSETFTYNLSTNGSEAFDSIFFSSGTFDVNLSSDLQSDVDFTFTIHSLKDKNTDAALVLNGTMTQASPTFNSTNQLADFKGDFTDDGQGGAATSSTVLVDLEYTINVEVGDNLNANDEVSFDISFSNPVFDQIFGNVGQEELDLNSQTIDLDFFSSFDNGNITFAEPKFTFSFDNGFGFPIGVDFQNVIATNSDGTDLALSGAVTQTAQIVTAPTLNQVGQSVKSEIILSADNSNIDDLMSHKPVEMTFDVVAQTNPPSVPFTGNFLDANSFLDVDIEVEIPLNIGIENLTAEQTMNFDNGEDLDNVKSVMLRLIVANGIPMGGSVEMIFRNGNTPVYTITDRPLFEAAPVGANGRVSSDAESVTDVTIDEDGINAMKDATSILVRATLNTTGVGSGEVVKLFNDYEMDIKLAMQAVLSVSTGGN